MRPSGFGKFEQITILTLFILGGFLSTRLFESRAQSTPQIASVSIKNGKLSVKGQNFSTGARIDIDGRTFTDSKGSATKLKSKEAAALAPGSYIVTVRNADSTRSAPFIFDFQASQTPRVTLSIGPTPLRVQPGATLQLTATARDAAGGELLGVAFTWAVANPAVATVDQTGLVRGIAAGTVRVTVSALRNEIGGDLLVEDKPSGPSITVTPGNPVINERNTLQLLAVVRDANGQPVPGAQVVWSSDNTTRVTITGTGLATGVARGFAAVTAQSGDLKATVSVSVVRVESSTTEGTEGTGEVRVDLAGRIYQTDSVQHVVRRKRGFGAPYELFTGAAGVRGKTDGPWLQARYDGVLGIGIDNRDGQVYLADVANHVVRAAQANGQVVTVAGGGQAGHRDGPLDQAQFNAPRGVAVGGDGRLYVADSGNHVLRVIDLKAKTVSTLAGVPGQPGTADGLGAVARFNNPQSIQLDADERNLIVADVGNGRVRIVTPKGQASTLGTRAGRSAAEDFQSSPPVTFSQLRSVGVDGLGNILVADQTGVQVLLRSGNDVAAQFPLAESSSLGMVDSVTLRGPAAFVFSQMRGKSQLVRVTVGTPSVTTVSPDQATLAGGAPVTVTGVNFTPDVAVFLDGTPVAGLQVNGSTQLAFTTPAVKESGVRTLTVQGRGGAAQAAFFIEPPNLKLINRGDVTTLAGGTTFTGDGGNALAASLAIPTGLAVDRSGSLLLADRENNRLRVVDAQTNLITALAGRGSPGGGGDGGPAIQAEFVLPEGVAVDPDGNIYVADSQNVRVRKIDAQTGIITTHAGGVSFGFGGDGGPATQASMGTIKGIACDRNGNLFIADFTNHRVRRVDARTNIITTVAGNGMRGFAGDGGPATAARLDTPAAVALDAAGNLFIADRNNHRIRRVDAQTGVITTAAGNGRPEFTGDGGTATAAGLQAPEGVAVDARGRLLVGDTFNHCVRAVDSATGTISTVAGQGGKPGFAGDGGSATNAQLNFPAFVAADGAGNVLISDTNNNRVRRVDGETNMISTFVGTGGLDFVPDGTAAARSRLFYPEGVHIDRQGNIFICEPSFGRVRRLDAATGALAGFAGRFELAGNAVGDGGPAREAGFVTPQRTASDSAGNVFIVDTMHGTIRRVDAASGIVTRIAGTAGAPGSDDDGGPAIQAVLNFPQGAAVGPDGNLYFAETGTHRVRRVNLSSGVIDTVAGTKNQAGFSGDGGAPRNARLSSPTDVAFDKDGNLHVADAGNNRVRRLNRETGTITTFAGNGTNVGSGENVDATRTGLNNPTAIAVDGREDVVIVERFGNRVRIVDHASRLIRTIAGTGGIGFDGDGGPATQAVFNDPVGVAIDGQGNVLISDRLNGRIRVVKEAATR